jgi:cell division protein FtsB
MNNIMKFVAVLLVVVVIAIIVIMVDDKASNKVQKVVQSVPLSEDVAKEKADKQLTAENTRLAKQNTSLTQQIADVTREKEVANADKVTLTGQVDTLTKENEALKSTNTDLQDKNTNLNEEITSRPEYKKLYEQETDWHISIGGMVTYPWTDPKGTTITALLSLGPPKWQVLTGVGWSLNSGISVSIGFMWSFGHPKSPK